MTTDESNIPEQLRDYNWQAAFEFAGAVEGNDWGGISGATFGNAAGAHPNPVEGFTGSTEPFGRRDVAEVIAAVDGERDGAPWVGVFRLKDGRFASLSAGCDYTGWDCRSSGNAYVAATREDIIRWGLDHGERQRLGLLLPGEENTTGGTP